MSKVIAGFGEVMLRLCPAGKKRLEQVLPGALEATFGGGEANVCASVAMLGGRSRYLTALPDNPIARAFANQLRGLGVDVEKIHYSKTGRMGVYYAEHGSALRGSNVVYDREYSTIAMTGPEQYDFPTMLAGVDHLHLSGITPALSEKAYLSTLGIAQTAAKMGVTISIDLNFRKKLWNWDPTCSRNELARKCMNAIVPLADVIIGNEEDASDVFGITSEGSSVESGKINVAGYLDVARQLAAKFQKAKFIAITLRESISADHNNWGGMLYDKASDRASFAPLDEHGDYCPYQIKDIVDRFGGGDSFCAGLLTALFHPDWNTPPAKAVSFAVAASALKHTIPGDYNYTNYADVVNLAGGNTSGRVKR
ncbi:MAG: sugar kinase [Victivallaceae bacterium]|nr:sugar kinase [Victivallaceae bacterium]